jgi:2-hydroxy-3-oxopropionate reductase
MSSKSIGVVGLGNAGRPIAERLLSKGYDVRVFDCDPEPVAALAKLGAIPASCAADTVSPLTLTVVPSSVEVRQAVLGPKGVAERIQPGQALIDLSGTDPDCARDVEEAITARGAKYLGATLHADGAPAVTIPKGLLSIVIGGDRATFDECVEPLKALAQKVIYVPDPGTPKAIKIAVIMLATANTIMLSEICTWLEAQKIDPRLFLKVQQINGSDGATARIEQFFKRARSYGGALSNSYKDLHQALALAPQLGLPLPFTSFAHQIQEMARTKGFRRLNSPAAIGKFYETMTGVSLERAAMENTERTFPEPHAPEVIYLQEQEV